MSEQFGGEQQPGFEGVAAESEAIMRDQQVKDFLGAELSGDKRNFAEAYEALNKDDVGVSQWEMAKELLDALNDKVAEKLNVSPEEAKKTDTMTDLYQSLEDMNPDRVVN